MIATRSFFDLLASKGWNPPVKQTNATEATEPPRPTVLKKKASSMLDLFSPGSLRPRTESCTESRESTAIAAPAAADRNHHQPKQQSPTRRPTKLKKCASDGATTFGGWGMIPVLNELEQHSSFYHNPTRRASQCVCRNCERLFFKHLSGVEADFCSLDCRASHAYASDVQDAIDTRLSSDSLLSSAWSSDWSSAGSSYSSSNSSVASLSSGS